MRSLLILTIGMLLTGCGSLPGGRVTDGSSPPNNPTLYPVRLQWTESTQYVDGSELSSSSLQGYLLKFGLATASPNQTREFPAGTNGQLLELSSGTYEFQIAAIADGVVGPMSNVVTKKVP